jgi:peptidyl-dipeptidase A
MGRFRLGAGFVIGSLLMSMAVGASMAGGGADPRARQFIQVYEASIRPLEIEVARRWWTANVSGKEEDYRLKEEAENELNAKLSDPEAFEELKAIRTGKPSDPQVARQIDVLYLQYLACQLDPALLKQMTAKSNAVERAFNTYRAKYNGRQLTDNDVRRVLRESKDQAERRGVWEASKGVARVVEADLKQLVRLRNEAAHKLGFKNFHVMQLALVEQSQEQVLKLFDDLDRLTREPFLAAKARIDAELAGTYGIGAAQLRPWHYHDAFFQEVPLTTKQAGREKIYAKLDILRLCRDYYAGIGLPIDDVLGRSDLYERPGKNPHAFSTDIDREGDVRVLANIVPDRQWLSTMLHELGHAAYSKYLPRELPYALRTESHPLTTEGIAMMMDRFADHAGWLAAMGVEVPEPAAFQTAAERGRRDQLLVFSRWCQVMFRFEMALYGDPEQDLGRVWWDLVERYQGLRRPEGRHEPDYASKIHIVIAPAYYHNYMMGEMFASQVHHAIARDVLAGADPQAAIYVGHPAVGQFLRDRVFDPGRTLPWNELTRHATGAELGVKAFAEDLQGQ